MGILKSDKSKSESNVRTNRCYSCDSAKGRCTDLEHGESTLDCPATKGCRIAKTLDSESPQWVRPRLLTSSPQFLTS